MDRCDVLILGGGPAGSSCAWALRAAGLDAVVMDRAAFPRDKVCAGWITPQILESLEIDPADYAKGSERVMQPIRGFRVRRIGSPEARVAHREVVSYGIRRCELDAWLLARSGARLRLGEPLRALRREGERWIANDAIEARALVGAGGHFCPVARHAGARPGADEPAVVAREIEFELTPRQQAACPTRPDLPELYFSEDLRGYGWVVRKGDWLNVGLGRQDPRAFPARVETFLDWLDARGLLPPDLPRALRGHAYLLHDQSPRPLSAEGMLLVGDAAGLAYGRSGEGIRPAVESGLLAARALRRAGGRATESARHEYQRAVALRLGPRFERVRPGVTERVPERWRGPLFGALLAAPGIARHLVVDRWFLHRHEPALRAGPAA